MTTKLPPRSFDDVWKEITDRASLYQTQQLPVYTLKKGFKNTITKVTSTEVHRRSERAQNPENPSKVDRNSLKTIWEILVQRGAVCHSDVKSSAQLYFNWALLNAMLRGLRFTPKPFGFEIADWNVLMSPYELRRRQEKEEVERVEAKKQYEAGRGGGESIEHKAIKEAVFKDPEKHLAEPMTPIRLEKAFLTGDVLDVLLQDTLGRYVCVEVEVDIGNTDDIGFHQAGKYRVLTAMEYGVKPKDVRAIVVARSIAAALAEKYGKYDIETRTVNSKDIEERKESDLHNSIDKHEKQIKY